MAGDVLVTPMHAERMDTICDVGRTRTDLEADFPGLDFRALGHGEDEWWYTDANHNPRSRPVPKEPDEVFQARVRMFERPYRGPVLNDCRRAWVWSPTVVAFYDCPGVDTNGGHCLSRLTTLERVPMACCNGSSPLSFILPTWYSFSCLPSSDPPKKGCLVLRVSAWPTRDHHCGGWALVVLQATDRHEPEALKLRDCGNYDRWRPTTALGEFPMTGFGSRSAAALVRAGWTLLHRLPRHPRGPGRSSFARAIVAVTALPKTRGWQLSGGCRRKYPCQRKPGSHRVRLCRGSALEHQRNVAPTVQLFGWYPH